MGYLTPEEVRTGITQLIENGRSQEDINSTLFWIAQKQAREVLKNNGFAPDFERYGYPPSDYLTNQELRRMEWLNEARHLEGCGDSVLEQAAACLLMDIGDIDQAKLLLMLAGSLLPAHQEHETSIKKLENIPKQNGGKGGGAKKGHESPIKQCVRLALERLDLGGEPDLGRVALKILKKLASDIDSLGFDDEDEIYKHGEICPIEAKEYNRSTRTLAYYDRTKPNKPREINFKRMKAVIKEIKNSQSEK
jgi:hypothetical protein